MRHYVHGSDGNKYGPADLAQLLEWKADGRVSPTTLLEPEVGGAPFEAQGLPGLFPEVQGPSAFEQPQPSFAPYPEPQAADTSANKLAVAAWVTGAAAIFCCPIGLGVASLVCAILANSKGHAQGKILIVYACLCLALGIGLNIWAMQMLKDMGMPI